MNYQIRLRKSQDYDNGLPEVTTLVSKCKPLGSDAARIHDLTSCSLYRFVAVVDESVVGTATLITHPKLLHGGCKAGQIEEVAVLPDYQGQGIGTALVEACKAQAVESGCYKVQLQCSADRDVQSFYGALGFDNRGEVTMRWDCETV